MSIIKLLSGLFGDSPRKRKNNEETIIRLLKTGEFSSAGITKYTRIQSGTLYPILLELEHRNIIKSRWEDDVAKSDRPRRRFYTIS